VLASRFPACRGLGETHRPDQGRDGSFALTATLALAAAGAEPTGEVTLSWGGYSVVTSLPVSALALGVLIIAATLVFRLLQALWRRGRRPATPDQGP